MITTARRNYSELLERDGVVLLIQFSFIRINGGCTYWYLCFRLYCIDRARNKCQGIVDKFVLLLSGKIGRSGGLKRKIFSCTIMKIDIFPYEMYLEKDTYICNTQ